MIQRGQAVGVSWSVGQAMVQLRSSSASRCLLGCGASILSDEDSDASTASKRWYLSMLRRQKKERKRERERERDRERECVCVKERERERERERDGGYLFVYACLHESDLARNLAAHHGSLFIYIYIHFRMDSWCCSVPPHPCASSSSLYVGTCHICIHTYMCTYGCRIALSLQVLL